MTEFTIKGTSIYFNGWRVAELLSPASVPYTVYDDFLSFVKDYCTSYADGYSAGREDALDETDRG